MGSRADLGRRQPSGDLASRNLGSWPRPRVSRSSKDLIDLAERTNRLFVDRRGRTHTTTYIGPDN